MTGLRWLLTLRSRTSGQTMSGTWTTLGRGLRFSMTLIYIHRNQTTMPPARRDLLRPTFPPRSLRSWKGNYMTCRTLVSYMSTVSVQGRSPYFSDLRQKTCSTKGLRFQGLQAYWGAVSRPHLLGLHDVWRYGKHRTAQRRQRIRTGRATTFRYRVRKKRLGPTKRPGGCNQGPGSSGCYVLQHSATTGS